MPSYSHHEPQNFASIVFVQKFQFHRIHRFLLSNISRPFKFFCRISTSLLSSSAMHSQHHNRSYLQSNWMSVLAAIYDCLSTFPTVRAWMSSFERRLYFHIQFFIGKISLFPFQQFEWKEYSAVLPPFWYSLELP